jgi:hypothetical protein
MSQKFIYNPVSEQIEITPGHENDPKTTAEKLLEKGFREKPLTNAELGIKPKKTEQLKAFVRSEDPVPRTGAQYIPKDQRLFETLKVPGYETAKKSDASYKKLTQEERRKQNLNKAWGLTDRKDPPVTPMDWKKDNHRWKKHLADTIAEGQQTIFYNKDTGGWRDKWDQERKPEEVLKEQQEIQKSYDSIFTPTQQKEYQKSLASKPIIQDTPIGKIKNLDKPNQRSNSWNDLKAGKITKVTKDRSPDTFDLMVETADPKELEELKKDHPDYPKFKLERLQKEQPPQDNSEMIHEMEQLAKMRLQQDINSQEFKKIMTTPEDPDLHKGINSVAGNEHIKKQFSNLSKFRNRSQRIRHARNTLGIGPYLTGEAD